MSERVYQILQNLCGWRPMAWSDNLKNIGTGECAMMD
jgi:hypothetical protein